MLGPPLWVSGCGESCSHVKSSACGEGGAVAGARLRMEMESSGLRSFHGPPGADPDGAGCGRTRDPRFGIQEEACGSSLVSQMRTCDGVAMRRRRREQSAVALAVLCLISVCEGTRGDGSALAAQSLQNKLGMGMRVEVLPFGGDGHVPLSKALGALQRAVAEAARVWPDDITVDDVDLRTRVYGYFSLVGGDVEKLVNSWGNGHTAVAAQAQEEIAALLGADSVQVALLDSAGHRATFSLRGDVPSGDDGEDAATLAHDVELVRGVCEGALDPARSSRVLSMGQCCELNETSPSRRGARSHAQQARLYRGEHSLL